MLIPEYETGFRDGYELGRAAGATLAVLVGGYCAYLLWHATRERDAARVAAQAWQETSEMLAMELHDAMARAAKGGSDGSA